jgi:hypothetical protein
LFAVIDVNGSRVVARGLNEGQAKGFASGWTRDNGEAVVVQESITWPTDDLVLERWQQAL